VTDLRGPGWDTETFLIRPGKLAPELVCLSIAAWDGVWLYHVKGNNEPLTLFGKVRPPARTAKEAFRWVLKQPVSYGLNVAYDVAVCLAQWPDMFEEVFEAYDADRVIDIGLSQRLVDIAKGKFKVMQALYGYSLAGLEKRLLKRDRSEQKEGPDIWRLRYRELYDVPLKNWPKNAVSYAAEDAVGTRDVGQYQWDSEDRKYMRDSPAQARAALGLQLMMCWGVMTDSSKIKELDEYAQKKYWELSCELAKPQHGTLVRGEDIIQRNLRWTKDVKAAQQRMLDVCRAQGIPIKLTDTGYKKYVKYLKDNDVLDKEEEVSFTTVFNETDLLKYTSVDEDACRRSGDEVLMAFSLRSQLHTVIHTHIEDLEKGVVTPIQPRYTTLVESGRTACSKSRSDDGKRVRSPTKGFQFQNPKRAYTWIPPGETKAIPLFPPGIGIRECFVSRLRKFFADNDFSGLELCTGAQACKDLVGYSLLADALNAGLDPHLDFGAALMGISYNDALKRKHDKEVKFFRQLAKIFNFGAPGGLGKKGIVAFARGYGVVLNIDQAADYKVDWLKKYPEWGDYFRWIRDQLELDLEELDSDSETEAVARVVGTFEQLRVGRIRGKCKFTEACNTFFQGLGADVSKRALWGVAKRCYMRVPGSVLYGVRPVGFIHDEILAEVDIELAHEQAYEMAQVMCDEGNVLLPDVPVKCVPALSKHWCKEAEAVFDKDGRLQPYDLAREGRWKVYFDQHAEFRVNWE
jgi:DNA polymerase-1